MATVQITFGTRADWIAPDRRADRTGPFRPVGPREWLAIERKWSAPRRPAKGAPRPIGSPVGRTAGAPAPVLADGRRVADVLAVRGPIVAGHVHVWGCPHYSRAIVTPDMSGADLWRLWYAMEDVRPARDSDEFAGWAAECAVIHELARDADARERSAGVA